MARGMFCWSQLRGTPQLQITSRAAIQSTKGLTLNKSRTKSLSMPCAPIRNRCMLPSFWHPTYSASKAANKIEPNMVHLDQQPVCFLDLSSAPHDVILVLLGHMDLQQRFTCALVCSDWAKAAAAATNTIAKHDLQDLTQLKQWLYKNGSKVETLQLRKCSCTLARLPCAQLQDLLLHGVGHDAELILGSRVWCDIAAATKLTSVQLEAVSTTAQQADVVTALTALPDLQQLAWRQMVCGRKRQLSDSRLLQQLTRLTGLDLQYVAAEVLQHLSLLTKLQRLSTHSPVAWAAADYPGLQELQGLTSLALKAISAESWDSGGDLRFPACVSHLTALQQLEVSEATATELDALTALTALTKLGVAQFSPSSQLSAVLQLPALQQLYLSGSRSDWGYWPAIHTSYLASCTQLRQLSLCSLHLTGPGSLVTSSMLQELNLRKCNISYEEDRPTMSLCEVLFPGPGRLPHLTSLVLQDAVSELQQAEVERLVACCSGLQELQLDWVTDEQCSSLVQLTGLRAVQVSYPWDLSTAGLRHLARLEQLTSLRFGHDFDSCKVNTALQQQLSDTVLDCKHAIVNQVGSYSWVVECCGGLTTPSCWRMSRAAVTHAALLLSLTATKLAGMHTLKHTGY